MRIGKLIATVCALAVLGGASTVAAQTPEQIVSAEELAAMRGGFDVDGFVIGFGADLRSFVDGALVMESRLTVDPNQSQAVFQTSAGDPLSPQILADMTARLTSGAGFTFGGVTSDGVTFQHNIGDGQLSNVLINTADNRDLRQEIAITLTLPGFDTVQAGMNAARLGQDLASESSAFAGGAR